MKTSFDIKWDNVYSEGNSLNEFPYTDLVSFFSNNFDKNQSKLKILEVGCGAGNNLEFLAKKGHEVYGLDASKNVINYADNRFRNKNLRGTFTVGEFTNLPYDNNFFDLIINRAAICHTDLESANIALKECHRVLKSSGILYSTFFSNLNSFKANKINFGYFDSFEEGFRNIGNLKFYNIFELTNLFSKNNFKVSTLYLIEKKDMISTPIKIHSEWILHSSKVYSS
jgi:ubiquinone/menaquinone biosynthesis C-methylase UbiE